MAMKLCWPGCGGWYCDQSRTARLAESPRKRPVSLREPAKHTILIYSFTLGDRQGTGGVVSPCGPKTCHRRDLVMGIQELHTYLQSIILPICTLLWAWRFTFSSFCSIHLKMVYELFGMSICASCCPKKLSLGSHWNSISFRVKEVGSISLFGK